MRPFSAIGEAVTNLARVRDELSFRNIRGSLWPVILIFPLSVIAGDLRYFNLHIEFATFESYELMLFPLGLGWLVLGFVPQKAIMPTLRVSALVSLLLLPFQFLLADDMGRLAAFMAFQLANGICAACAFALFCFRLNHVEMLFGMAIIQLYYVFYYTIYRTFPEVQAAVKSWAGVAVVAFFVVVALLCKEEDALADTKSDGKGSGVLFVICLDIVYYMIMCTINYIEGVKDFHISSMAFGLGNLSAIGVIIVVQLLWSRSALHLFVCFLAFSLLGIGVMFIDAPAALLGGSFMYGIGDTLGYIPIYYLCAGAIKKSKSLRMFRMYCFFFFVEYFVISGIVSRIFEAYEGSNLLPAFINVLILSSVCFLLMPVIQKKFLWPSMTSRSPRPNQSTSRIT